MRISEADRSLVGSHLRLTAMVPEPKGDSGMQLLIQGPARLLKKMIPEEELEVIVRPGAGREEWEKEVSAVAASQEQIDPLQRFDDLNWFFKKARGKRPAPPPPTAANSVLVALRRTRPGGTLFGISMPILVVPFGTNLVFRFPWAFRAAGFAFPRAGNPNLFLHNGSPAAPILSAGTVGGLAPDSVGWASAPWAPILPVFRIFGAGAGLNSLHFIAYTIGLP